MNPSPSCPIAALPPRALQHFRIGVDRRDELKWRFPQENATFHQSQKVYVNSENALGELTAQLSRTGSVEAFDHQISGWAELVHFPDFRSS
jgi:hypothetical protein